MGSEHRPASAARLFQHTYEQGCVQQGFEVSIIYVTSCEADGTGSDCQVSEFYEKATQAGPTEPNYDLLTTHPSEARRLIRSSFKPKSQSALFRCSLTMSPSLNGALYPCIGLERGPVRLFSSTSNAQRRCPVPGAPSIRTKGLSRANVS